MGCILAKVKNWDEDYIECIVVVDTTNGRVSQQVYSADTLLTELKKLGRENLYEEFLEDLETYEYFINEGGNNDKKQTL